MSEGDESSFFQGSREYCPITNDINEPRISFGKGVDFPDGLVGEKPLARFRKWEFVSLFDILAIRLSLKWSEGADVVVKGRDLQAMHYIAPGLFLAEGGDIVIYGDSLANRSVLRAMENVIEFYLADEKYIKQFAFGTFNVGKKTNFLQQILAYALRFINDENHLAPSFVGIEEELLKLDKKGRFAGDGVNRHTEGMGRVLEKIQRVKCGVSNEGHVRVVIQSLKQGIYESGFTGTDIAGEQ